MNCKSWINPSYASGINTVLHSGTQCSLWELLKYQHHITLHCYSIVKSSPPSQWNDGTKRDRDHYMSKYVFDRYFIQIFHRGFTWYVWQLCWYTYHVLYTILYTYFLILIICKHLLPYLITAHASYVKTFVITSYYVLCICTYICYV